MESATTTHLPTGDGVRKADELSDACPQSDRMFKFRQKVTIQIGGDSSKIRPPDKTSEDCLYLNVMTPRANATERRPAVQLDLQREFHRAREKTASLYSIPQLPVRSTTVPARVDLATIRHAIVGTHRAFQLLQPQLKDEARRKLRRLAQRLLTIDYKLDYLTPK